MTKRSGELHERRLAYIQTFCGDGEVPHVAGAKVLADLKRFCRINRGGLVISPVSKMVDSHATAYQAGMRDVFLRIAEMLQFDESQAIHTQEQDNGRAESGTDPAE